MDRRSRLQYILEEILGSRQVYYQQPNGVEMIYPAIVYSRNNIQNDHADNRPYKQSTAYEVTVIDENPDSDIVTRISKLPYCRFNRHFTSENLNHDVFTLYF